MNKFVSDYVVNVLEEVMEENYFYYKESMTKSKFRKLFTQAIATNIVTSDICEYIDENVDVVV